MGTQASGAGWKFLSDDYLDTLIVQIEILMIFAVDTCISILRTRSSREIGYLMAI